MKALLLSVALLFFTGAQGRYFWQQDEPNEEQTYTRVIENILDHGVEIIASVANDLDLKEIAKEYHITEAWEAAEKHAEILEKSLEGYFEEVWKRFDGHLKKEFPVLREKVFPILEEFDDNIVNHLEKVVKEAVLVGSDLLTGISKNVINFFENLESIAEKCRDNLRVAMDNLRAKVNPYADGVHAEYERYRNNLQDELQKDIKELKEDVQKQVEKAKKHAMPVIENIRKKLPDGKELQERIEQLVKEYKEYIADM